MPSLAEIDAIAQRAEPITRNLGITLAYHELSIGLAAWTGPTPNWCTFATWASKQAGQTIRGHDLARALEAELDSEEIGAAATRLGDVLRVVGHTADRSVLLAAVREAASPVRAAERASEAVARGNAKVFEELGPAFARLLAALDAGGGALPDVVAGLRTGPLPDGQDLLRAAFAGYGRALTAADADGRAEQILLANLRIGLHEQTRLQPEIAEALDAPVAQPQEVKAHLLARLLPTAPRGRRLEAGDGPLDDVTARLVAVVRRRVRRILTEHLMTLDLAGTRLRLGRDVIGTRPLGLREPRDAELRELLATIEPAPDSTVGSGARDWADLGDRMHYIAELFRTRQEDTTLLAAPFDAGQAAEIHAGRLPVGRL